MSEGKHTCCKPVSQGRFRSAPCGKTAKVERDGKWYCGTHDPVARRAKLDAKYEAWKEKALADAASREKAAREREFNAAAAHAIKKIAAGHNDPMAVARALIEEFPDVGDNAERAKWWPVATEPAP